MAGSLPDWTTDEVMLALDLYLRERDQGVKLSKGSPSVALLSEELRSLPIHPNEVRSNPTFRNVDGVALKIHNLQSVDPTHPGEGMGHGSRVDREVWEDWADRPDELAAAVAEIRRLGSIPVIAETTGEDEEATAIEGRILYRNHRRLERNPTLAKKKRKRVMAQTGRLACEVCDFESGEVYGVPGVIDVHHLVPLHVQGEGEVSLSDLALLCPTCHRTVHKHRPFLTPDELRQRRSRP